LEWNYAEGLGTDKNMTHEIKIGDRAIGNDSSCYIIAEAGVNHNGDLQQAIKLVDVAKEAGADAVKFQLFRVEEQVSCHAATASYQRKHTGAKSMKQMAASYDLPWEAHRDIAAHCQDLGITYMASCFDRKAVDFLLSINGDCIKIASGEITNFPLLTHAASTGKPILLSTGMSTLADISGAVDIIEAQGAGNLVLFHCVSSYPAAAETINLRVMNTLKSAFGTPVGFSDHTIGNAIAVAAVAMGASLLEKHFTLDKRASGPDHAMSLDPSEMKEFVRVAREAEMALGDGVKYINKDELKNRDAVRRSLVSKCAITVGESLQEENVTLKRPAAGIDPRMWDVVRGRKAIANIPADTPITWKDIK